MVVVLVEMEQQRRHPVARVKPRRFSLLILPRGQVGVDLSGITLLVQLCLEKVAILETEIPEELRTAMERDPVLAQVQMGVLVMTLVAMVGVAHSVALELPAI